MPDYEFTAAQIGQLQDRYAEVEVLREQLLQQLDLLAATTRMLNEKADTIHAILRSLGVVPPGAAGARPHLRVVEASPHDGAA